MNSKFNEGGDEWLKMYLEGIDSRLSNIEMKMDRVIEAEAKKAGKISGIGLVLSAIISMVVSAIAIYTK